MVPAPTYKAKKVMEDPEAARAAGLVMDATAEACSQCHNDESPTFRGFDFQKAGPKSLTRSREMKMSTPAPATTDPEMPGDIVFNSSVGDVTFSAQPARSGRSTWNAWNATTRYTPRIWIPRIRHTWSPPGSIASICHDTNSKMSKKYYKCSDCHHSNLDNIADETLSSKVVIHKSCWKCHETGTGVDASKGCVECHVKAGK